MQIRFLVPSCTPENSHGRYVIELAKRLSGQHQITIHAGAFWPPLRSLAACRFLPVPPRPAAARLAALWTASIVAFKRKASDIVHVQGADAPIGNVVTAHCCNAAMRAAIKERGTLPRRLNYALGAAVERYCFTNASTRHVIAVSRKVKEEIQTHYGVDPARIVVIPHGVDLEAFHPQLRERWRTPTRNRWKVSRDEFLVLFVGGDYRLKGLITLLEAVGRIEGGVKVIAVGVKADSLLDHVVKRTGLTDRVTFLGKTTEIASFYAAADCFILPTRYDTFSLATLEAMASGLPVVVSIAAGISDLLSPERDSLVLEDPNDVDALAQCLLRLMRDDSLRKSLAEGARGTAENHSWDDVAARTLAVYHQSIVDPR